MLAAAAITLAFAAAAFVLRPPRPWSALVGGILALLCGWLLTQASYAGAVAVVASGWGFGAGSILAGTRRATRTAAGLAAIVPALCLVLGRLAGIDAAAWAGVALLALAASLVVVPGWRNSEPAPWRLAGATTSAVVIAAFAVFWVGSTSPRVTWFGSLTWHGPRSGNEVAITFDDGPNGETTLAIAAILEDRGVRGTFFEVGKAVVQQPDITRELIARGHVVGNHSYEHDAWRYLDPAYPELDRAETAIRDAAGVCPALFRPPHGTHTPFMSAATDDRDMTLVTWDVSARDWVETDAGRIARDILDRVKRGSIILLHDGIDGNLGAGRSATLRALPLILDGLAAKGLVPVTVDRLLEVEPYRPAGAC